MSPQRVSDSVCTPHHSGRAFDVAHGYPLPPAFERTLSIPISRHHDILLLIRRRRSSPIPSIPLSLRYPRRPNHPSSQPVRRDSLLTRPPSGCLIFRLSRFNSPTAQRRITEMRAYQRNYMTKKDLLSQVNSTF